MKRSLMCALVLLVGAGAFAQEDTGYVAVLPGYQSPSGSRTEAFAALTARAAQKDHWLASLDAGWYFTDCLGVHAGYIYMPSDVEAHVRSGAADLGTRTIGQNANILEIGPEFYRDLPWDRGQVYAQLNLGRPFGSGGATSYAPNTGTGGAWSLGGAVGYRYPLNAGLGLTIQGAFHHVHNWPSENVWDVRAGVVVRFPRPAPPRPSLATPTPRPTPPPLPPAPPTRAAQPAAPPPKTPAQ